MPWSMWALGAIGLACIAWSIASMRRHEKQRKGRNG